MAEESRKATSIARACVALAAVAVLVFVIDLLEGPFFSLSTRTWTPERRGDRLIGGIEGAVKGADVSTGTVRVASGFLGLASLPVVITPQTQIAINGKLGGFADLDRGQFVRVAYEVLPDRLVAWRVNVLDRVTSETVVPPQIEGAPAVGLPSHGEKGAPPPAAGTASSSPASSPAEASASVSSVKASSPSSVPPWRAAPSVASPPSASASPTRQNAARAKRAVVAPSSSPRTQVQDPPRPAPAAASRPSTPATGTPGTRQAEDGGDAIDWLLKESATRGQ